MKLRSRIMMLVLSLVSIPGFASSKITFFEFTSCDLVKSSSFYERLFGWKLTPAGPDFVTIEGAGINGGIVKDCRPSSGRPNTKIFVNVEDLKSAIEKARALGAKLEIPPTQVGPTTQIAEVRDLDQNIVGFIYEKGEPK